MPYTAQFFAEKLNAPVEYFNPFRNVQIDPAVNLEELARVAHSLGEVVGLGLRNLANCPVEMNLMPESTLHWRAFNEKKPYFTATVFSLVVVAFAVGILFSNLASSKEDELQKLQPEVQRQQAKADEFNQIYQQVGTAEKEADQIATWMDDRYYWGNVLAELRQVLVYAESDVQKKLSAEKPGVQAGIWIEQMTTMTSAGPASGPIEEQHQFIQQFQQTYFINGFPSTVPPKGANPTPTQTPTRTPTQTNQIKNITLVCRAVSLAKVDPAANSAIAYTVENELQASPYFDPKATQLTGAISAEDASGTFTFGITAVLKNPLNL
jgi:hypothetical protein